MDIDAEIAELSAGPLAKPKAKAKKPAAKKAAKPKAKKVKATKKKPPVKKPAKPFKMSGAKKQHKAAVKKAKAKAATIARPERLDMRLSKAEKAKLLAKAKKLRRTVTSIMLEAIEKIR